MSSNTTSASSSDSKQGSSGWLDPMQKKQSQANLERGETGSANGGNNSDNSAVSLGNTSFGFNFDSEEGGMSGNGTPPNPERSDNSDSDGNAPNKSKGPATAGAAAAAAAAKNANDRSPATKTEQTKQFQTAVSSLSNDSKSTSNSDPAQVSISTAHSTAAANAAANLKSIATSFANSPASFNGNADSRKRKAEEQGEDDSGGYDEDDDDDNENGGKDGESNDANGKSKKKKLNQKKREERNAREKERSFRISKQISELRALLSSGGVIVPKGTKSSVLTEAASYIRMLQQHQYRSEIDRQQLVQQMQLIGSGAHGPQAAQAIRHVAAQNGVWSLGNFGGVPPKSAMSAFKPNVAESSSEAADPTQQTVISTPDYRFVFNSCGVGMAIASMGGAFIDCNQLFTLLSDYSKQEICGLTIFNITARQDLQTAFDHISQLISPPIGSATPDTTKPVILRGAMKNRTDLGLSVSLIKGDDGIAKCFCVTLIKNPTSPFDSAKPIPASFDSVLPQTAAQSEPMKEADSELKASPAFTSG